MAVRRPFAASTASQILIWSSSIRVELDAILTETHEASAEVTKHPVESQADVSDHIRPQPRKLEIVGVVSGYPIREAGMQARDWVIREYERLRLVNNGILAPISGQTTPPLRSLERAPLPSLIREGEGQAEAAWDALVRICSEGQTVTVSTPSKSYPNLAIASLHRRRSAGETDLLEAAISLVEVFKVGARTAQIPPNLLGSQDMGSQSAIPASPGQSEQATEAIANGGHQPANR